MNPILGLLLFAAIVMAAFFVLRYVVKLQFPNLGRIASAAMISIYALLDQFQALPWGSVLDDARAKIVGFAILAGMGVLHAIDRAKQGE
jgi:hypothetical protein